MSFTVAIVGRPNVGKSTLFNRLAGRKLALVDDTPGVTRDRRDQDIEWGGLRFRLTDTAGLEEAPAASLAGRMRAQTDAAIAQADVCLFMIDARAGPTPLDEHFANLLRKSGKPVLLLANKCEGARGREGAGEAYALGFGDPIVMSAEHGEGMSDLYQALLPFYEERAVLGADETVEALEAAASGDEADQQEDAFEPHPDRPIKVAIVGRPNAGKSTLINRYLGEERLLTGPEAGITRDAIAVPFKWRDQAIELFDTAGMRRKAKVQEKLEKLSVSDALRAVRFAEVVVLLLDAASPFDKQDLQIADLVEREGRALVIAVNKWDEVADPEALRRELQEELERLLPQLRGVALVPLSALTGRGIDKLMDAVLNTYSLWNSRIATARLNRWLEAATAEHPPPAVRGRRIRLRYMTQAKSRPPTFVVFSQRAAALPASYSRYLVNGLRQAFGLPGVPLRIHLRAGKNPYADKG